MNIGITGRMQNGKDTVAKMIYEMSGPFQITHFADPLKDICMRYLNLTSDDVYTDEGKKRFNDFWGMTNREILQKVGTDAFRNGFKSDIWVKLMELKIKNCEGNYIIPDVRFDDEAKVILDNGGIIINVVRPDKRDYSKESNHESEKGVSPNLITFTIINDGTLSDLNKKVQGVLKEIVKLNVDKSFQCFKEKYPEDFKEEWERYKPFLYKIKNPCFYIFFSDYGVQIERTVKQHDKTKNFYLYLEKDVCISTNVFPDLTTNLIEEENCEKCFDRLDDAVIEEWNKISN